MPKRLPRSITLTLTELEAWQVMASLNSRAILREHQGDQAGALECERIVSRLTPQLSKAQPA